MLGPWMLTWTGAVAVFFLVVLGYSWCNCALRHAKLNKPPARGVGRETMGYHELGYSWSWSWSCAGCAGPWMAPSNGPPDNEAVGGVGSSRAR